MATSPSNQSPAPSAQLHPDHEGLEVVSSPPKDITPPEVVTARNKPSTPYSDGPEVYEAQPQSNTAAYYAPPEKVSQYEYNATGQQSYAPEVVNSGHASPYQEGQQPYNSSGYQPVSMADRDSESPDPESGKTGAAAGKSADKKRICGMSRKAFFWLVGVIAVVIVLGAVLGGVLGSVLGGSSSSSSSSSPSDPSTPASTASPSALPSIYSSTGLAIDAESGTKTTFSYYQDPSGRIIENNLENGNWSVMGSDVPNTAIVATNARKGSPIAATSYTQNGDLIRQIFYIDSNSQVMTSNTTGSDLWSLPYSILTDDTTAPNSIALSVISDTNTANDGLNGIRVYYASTAGLIREAGMDFNKSAATPVWYEWAYFPESDADSGAASVLSGGFNHLYLRNSTTGAVQQWKWDYVHVSQWYPGVAGPTNIAAGSSIAAANDGAGIDHVFYTESDSSLIHNQVGGAGFVDASQLDTAAGGTKLSASWFDAQGSTKEGALVFYQGSGNDSGAMAYQVVNDNNKVVLSGVAA